ncbi:MAG: malto-oligosyltrehalose trehalohydrolase, partial [Deltaproteobacteria bacterium]
LGGIAQNTLYRFRMDEGEAFADPCSRYQPHGVFGPSCVVDPTDFCWSDEHFAPPPLRELVIYELHVGTFTPAGTFAAVREKLTYLHDLGIGAIELMPVHDFPGRWNWGYDCAALFAPSRAYGTPNELRALVDAAHKLGISVLMDVVYNHFGPSGAFAPAFSQQFFSARHHTAWGQAINLDGPGSDLVRAFFVQHACQWLQEYHIDALRLDATGALRDEGPKHFLQQLSESVAALPGPPRLLIAEDPRNLARLVWPRKQGGYGLDGIWVDDFHHQMHVTLTGESAGYYRDYTPGAGGLAQCIRRNWLYCGQHSAHWQRPRGTEPLGVQPEHAVICLQNHDQ